VLCKNVIIIIIIIISVAVAAVVVVVVSKIANSCNCAASYISRPQIYIVWVYIHVVKISRTSAALRVGNIQYRMVVVSTSCSPLTVNGIIIDMSEIELEVFLT